MTVIIPQSSPRAAYLEQKAEIDLAVRRVLEGGHYILGPEVQAFEAEFATFSRARFSVGVANGTDAIAIALRALGVGRGDGVITVSHTATATVSAIRAIGAIPIFVDVDARHGLLDPQHLETFLQRQHKGAGDFDGQIKVILPVHLYGRCADLSAIVQIAERFELALVEDCAQAHGAMLNGRAAGTWGSFGAYSFYPTKNLGAIGDGGALITSSPELDRRARQLRQYGWQTRYVSDEEGFNSRLDELQAAILRVKLRVLGDATRRRIAVAKSYASRFGDSVVQTAECREDGRHVYHQYAIRSENRDSLQRALARRDIQTLIHYPVPVHRQPAYRSCCIVPREGLPNTERWAQETLSLPMFPQLDEDAIDRVGKAVIESSGELLMQAAG